jgi:hypothetical protein
MRKRNYITVFERCSFTRSEAADILRAHIGDRGLLNISRSFDHKYYPDGKVLQVGIWHGIGDYEVLGEGVSWRRAFEDAGVFFENGKTYKL